MLDGLVAEDSMYNTGLAGYLAELYFEYLASVNGVILSKPIYPLTPYDYIAQIGDRLLRCQVKKGSQDKYSTCWVCELRRTRSKRTGMTAYPRVSYNDGDFDFLCTIVHGEIYIIPWQVIRDKHRSIALGGETRDKYIKFRDNWEFKENP